MLPQLAVFAPQLLRSPGEVRASHDVTVLVGTAMGDAVQHVTRRSGHRPYVLIVAPEVDPDDVIRAFNSGATGYYVTGYSTRDLPEAVRCTARGVSWVSPEAASVLVRWLRQRPTDALADSANALTPRERQIMDLLAQGLTVTEIASNLSLTTKTIRNNLSSVFRKLNVRRQAEAVLHWLSKSSEFDGAARSDSARDLIHPHFPRIATASLSPKWSSVMHEKQRRVTCS